MVDTLSMHVALLAPTHNPEIYNMEVPASIIQGRKQLYEQVRQGCR